MSSDKPSIKEKLDVAKRILERKDPYDPQVHSDHVEVAKEMFEEVLAISPDSYDALIGLGRCSFYSPKEYEKTVSLFDRAAAVKPAESEPHFRAGMTLLRAGENFGEQNPLLFDRAIGYFHQAVDRGHLPLSEALGSLGTVYYRRGDYLAAIKWLELSINALDKDAWAPDVFYLCGESYREIGNYEAAIKLYERYKQCGLPDREIEKVIKGLKKIMGLEGSAKDSERL